MITRVRRKKKFECWIDVTIRFKGSRLTNPKPVTFYDPKQAESYKMYMLDSFGPGGNNSMDWIEVFDRKANRAITTF